MTDTIYACASGPGPSAIAIYRVSGDASDATLAALGVRTLPAPRAASLRRLRHPKTGSVIDEAVVLRFVEGASYTGEASFELHIHGGAAVRSELERALEAAGARLAQPGEFSRRAFLNGRLDLNQAEAIASLIHAETEAQRLQALEVLDGAVGVQAAQWRSRIIEAAALLETGIDFVEEGIEASIRHDALDRLVALTRELRLHIDTDRRSAADVSAPIVVLLGRPNAGKSSLLNAILERDAAIVSDRAGTTRDAIVGDVMFNGVRVRVTDTAGVRETADELERAGIDRARSIAERADLRILVLSADTGTPDRALLEMLKPTDAILWTKADLAQPSERDRAEYPEMHTVSANDGSAAMAFEAALTSAGLGARAAGSPIAGTERRRRLLDQASASIEAALSSIKADSAEAAIEDLRHAAGALEQLIGTIGHEDVLDALFSRFCIGK